MSETPAVLDFMTLLARLDRAGALWWLVHPNGLLGVNAPDEVRHDPLIAASIRAHRAALADTAVARGWDPASGWIPPSVTGPLAPGASEATQRAYREHLEDLQRRAGGAEPEAEG